MLPPDEPSACQPSQDGSEPGYDSLVREAARVSNAPALPPPPPLTLGARLAEGRFEVRRVLGRGGMGVVYAAHDHLRGGQVALKVLHGATPESLERLRREFLVLHDLVHPQLVTLGELLDDAGRWFFTMELVAGEDFLRHVRPGAEPSDRPGDRPGAELDVVRLRAALAQLAAGLAFLHAAGKLHRDVKPSNVLVQEGRVVLLDFGLAAAIEPHGDGDAGPGGGTPAYMAPEQERGGGGPAADWYALGVMLWEALTGRLPFLGPVAQLTAAKRAGPPPRPQVAELEDLAELACELLAPEPAQRPDGAALARRLGFAVPVARRTPRFVGRAAERAALGAALAAAHGGSAALLLHGPSGIGKSALVTAFLDDARQQGALVLRDRCHERVALPFQGLHGVATALAQHLSQDDRRRAAALAVPDVELVPASLPALARLVAGGAQPGVRDPAERRARMFAAFAGLLALTAQDRPVVLALDDLQWAERDGLALLQHLVTQVPRGLLILATATDALMRDGGWTAPATRLALGPLSAPDARALAAALTPTSPAELDALLEEAAGHPLHLAELLAHRARGAGVTGVRLQEVLTARVRELPAAAEQLLALVALAGAPLPQRVLAEAAALDGAAWWTALGALRAARLVTSAGLGTEEPVEPSHDRVRAAVRAQLDEARALAAHQRLAHALQAHPLAATRPELVAEHLEASGARAPAAGYLERAAQQAAQALAFDRAAVLLRRALRLTEASTDEAINEAIGEATSEATEASTHEARGEVLARLQRQLGEVCADGGRGAEAAEAYLAAAAHAPPGAELPLLRQAAEQLLRSGRIDDGLQLMDRVLARCTLPALSRRRWAVPALLLERARLWARRRLGAGPATLALAPGAQQERLAACWSAVVGASLVSPLRGAEFGARHLRLALGAGDVRRIALGLAMEAGGAAIVGPPAPRAHATLREAAQWAERADEPLVHAYLDLARGSVAFLTGQWREALARCQACEEILRTQCVGASWELGTAQRMSLTALWHLGQIRELRQRVAQVMQEARRRSDRYAALQLQTVLTPVLHLMDDRVELAEQELAEARQGLPRLGVTLQHWQLMQAGALVALYRGAPQEALALLDREVPALRRGFLFRVHAVRLFTAFVEGAAALGAAGEPGPHAARARRRARAVHRRLAARRGHLPAAALLAAQLAVLDGDQAAARASYRRAIAGFEEHGMRLLAASARWRLAELLDEAAAEAERDQVTALLAAEQLVAPARVVAMFAPVRAPVFTPGRAGAGPR